MIEDEFCFEPSDLQRFGSQLECLAGPRTLPAPPQNQGASSVLQRFSHPSAALRHLPRYRYTRPKLKLSAFSSSGAAEREFWDVLALQTSALISKLKIGGGRHGRVPDLNTVTKTTFLSVEATAKLELTRKSVRLRVRRRSSTFRRRPDGYH
ncbi:hypothetical protein BT69DRAFT_112354 [Atractiella rhizophila]|nr:hypothetical protein BT69DRAFT_112354 [Atractiella rhizophila]